MHKDTQTHRQTCSQTDRHENSIVAVDKPFNKLKGKSEVHWKGNLLSLIVWNQYSYENGQ